MNGYLVGAGALLVGCGAITGCSTAPDSASSAPGGLVAGTAEVVVGGKTVANSQAVACSTVAWFTTVDIGSSASGATAYVSSDDELTPRWVQFRNLGGFTGSYDAANGRDATIAMTGSTYEIAGTAQGFEASRPGVTVRKPFRVKVAC